VTAFLAHSVQVVAVALMVLGVVAVYFAAFQLWQPRSATSTRRAWALGLAGMLVILVGVLAV
jgi:hypothetical protein